jgi:succinate dehydrogenase/fumarate reductase cytochrome b subunit
MLSCIFAATQMEIARILAIILIIFVLLHVIGMVISVILHGVYGIRQFASDEYNITISPLLQGLHAIINKLRSAPSSTELQDLGGGNDPHAVF